MIRVWLEGQEDGDRIYLSGNDRSTSIQEGQLSHTHSGWSFVSRHGSPVPFPSGNFKTTEQALEALSAAGVEIVET